MLAIRVVLLVVGIALLGFAAWVNRRREGPALRPFVLLVAVLGVLAVADAVAAGNLTSLSIVWVTAYLAIPCAFGWFVVEYYGLPHLASPARKVAFLAPAVVGAVGGLVLVLSPSAAGSMTGSGPTAAGVPSLLGVAGIAEQVGIYYASGVMLASVALLGRTVARYEHLEWSVATRLSFVAVWPWAAYFATPVVATEIPLEAVVGGNAGGYVLSTVAVGYAVIRGGLFDAAPAAGTLGPETVLADLEDPVVVVDRDQRVVQLNDAAVETFEVDPETATGDSLSSCVGADLDALADPETVELSAAEGSRQFEASVSPVTDRYDRQPGSAVVLTDVTQERIRSQRLTVLNRVLRHNLRNEMNAIMGRAELIAGRSSEHTDSAEQIVESAQDLVSLSERARQVQQMMSGDPDGTERVVLADLADTVLDAYRSPYPEASLSVDVEASLSVVVDRQTLSHVLENLVENALVHNDAPTPVVTVSARETEEGVRLSVSDNGPGLPDHERAVIEAGDESSLEHGSGIGLWAVKWGVIRLGGDVEFTDNNPQGTVATVYLPQDVATESPVPAAAEAD